MQDITTLNLAKWEKYLVLLQSYVLKAIRLKYNLTQSEVGKLISLNQGTVSRIEKLEGKSFQGKVLILLYTYFDELQVFDFLKDDFFNNFHEELVKLEGEFLLKQDLNLLKNKLNKQLSLVKSSY